jgi:hypothetical protein
VPPYLGEVAPVGAGELAVWEDLAAGAAEVGAVEEAAVGAEVGTVEGVGEEQASKKSMDKKQSNQMLPREKDLILPFIGMPPGLFYIHSISISSSRIKVKQRNRKKKLVKSLRPAYYHVKVEGEKKHLRGREALVTIMMEAIVYQNEDNVKCCLKISKICNNMI